jgi:hypothetical protein
MTTPVAAVTDGSDPTGDELIAATLAAHASGIPVDEYLQARTHGIGDAEIRTAHHNGYPLSAYVACRTRGASGDALDSLIGCYSDGDMERLGGVGVLLRHYAAALQMGVTHDEFMAARDGQGKPLPHYLDCRSAGATHAEIREYTDLAGYLHLYEKARAKGVTHAELLDTRAVHINEAFYMRTLGAGIAHSELMEAHAQDGAVNDYVKERERGCTHAQALSNQHAIIAGERGGAPGCTPRPSRAAARY